MVKYKESVKAAWSILTERSRKFKKSFSRDAIGVLGGILILVFIVIAGSILWVCGKFDKKKNKNRDTFLHR